MHRKKEFGNATLTQRLIRDDHWHDQVTIDFGLIDDDYHDQKKTLGKSGLVTEDKDETMRIKLIKTSSRLSVILVLALFFLFYVFFFKRNEPSFEDMNIDVSAIERELESDDRVNFMTYQPLTYLPAGAKKSRKGNVDKRKDRNSLDGGAESDKYHKIWVWANASINIHEFFPDTPDVDLVLEALATAPITHVEALGPSKDLSLEEYIVGTAQKWLVTLEGGQKALVKLAWEEKTVMKENANCNYGYEMPWAEVAAFHLHRVLGFRNTPYVVGRKINLTKEIVPHASERVKAQLSTQGGRTCVTGKCHFCEDATTWCPPDGVVTASVAYWVPRKLKLYTYPPKYMPFSTPNMEEWGKIPFSNKTYCDKIRKEEPYNADRYYHDLFDFAVVDAISYHFDSKHYILHDASSAGGLTVRLDHGRAFCASDRDDDQIFLAPIFQCCTLRWETLWALQALTKGALRRDLTQAFAKDKTWGDLLHEDHFVAMERRLQKVIDLVERCAAANGARGVFVG